MCVAKRFVAARPDLDAQAVVELIVQGADDLGRSGFDELTGHGRINFEEIIRNLNFANYKGPLSVEWEDQNMDREHGAREAAAYVKKIDFAPSAVVFDAQFDR